MLRSLPKSKGLKLIPNLHSLRLSWQKTNLLMRSALLIITQFRPSRGLSSRVVGEIGHAHSFRPCLRSLFEDLHVGLRKAWENKASRVEQKAEYIR